MTVTERTPTSINELADRYDQAWNDHDLDAIVSLLAPDARFIIRGAGGSKAWEGIDACRGCFEFLLKAWPDQRMERTDLFIGDGFFVANLRFTGTPALPWEMGDRTYQPVDGPIEVDMVDIVHCQDNQVKVKDGWLDGFAMARQFEAQGG